MFFKIRRAIQEPTEVKSREFVQEVNRIRDFFTEEVQITSRIPTGAEGNRVSVRDDVTEAHGNETRSGIEDRARLGNTAGSDESVITRKKTKESWTAIWNKRCYSKIPFFTTVCTRESH